jgi:uncharacterized membrane protein
MEPKTTLNLLIAFFLNIIQKTILFFPAFFNKKAWLIPFSYTLFLVLCTSISFAQSGSCSATLQVEKDRDTRSTPPDGTYYTLIISNTGMSAQTYTLSSSNVNSSCANNDGSNTTGNVNLTANFVDTNLNSISEISLSPGQSVSFLVNIKVPVGTSVNKWNCTQITASSSSCSNYSVNTVLHTLVNDPNQD